MAVIETGGSTAGLLNVNSTYQAMVALSGDSSTNGILAVTGRSDDGAFAGSVHDIPVEVDEDYRMRVAQDAIIFQESFAGAAINSKKWQTNLTTFTSTVASSYMNINASAVTTANAVGRVTSYTTFPIAPGFHLQLDIPIQIAAASIGIPNTTVEFGAFIASGTTAPTDGVFVRINASGQMFIVGNFNGVETQSAQIDYTLTPTGWSSPLLDVNVDRQCLLVIAADHVELWIDNVLAGTLTQPVGQPVFTQAQQLPLNFRVYNGATPPASATTLKIGPVTVSMGGMSNMMTYADALAISESGAYQGQSGGTMGNTANNVNSTVPATATLSNTAAGYTTLGGRFLFNAPAGAETDYALFGYQVPAPTASAHNKGILIRNLRLDAVNLGAAVATTATVLEWSIGVGSTAVSLATADAVTTRAPSRVTLGVQSWVVGAAIGQPVESIDVTFDSPLYAPAGTFVHIILRCPVGTATASQTIRGVVSIIGTHI